MVKEVRSVMLKISEAAKLLNVSEGTIRNEIKRGRLKVLRLGIEGKAVRILQSEIERFIQAAMCVDVSNPKISNI